MIYVLFGNQDLMVKNRLARILKERLGEIDDFNCIKFDGSTTLIQDIIYEATLMPLGVERKAIVVYNAPFLTGEKSKNKIASEQDFAVLEDYLEHQNEECDLIFAVNAAKLDEKNKLVKAVLAKAQVAELVDLEKNDWNKYAMQLFEKLNVKIDADALNELLKRINSNAYLLNNEAKKLALYTDKITLADVELMISRPLEENVFQILDSLIKNKTEVAIRIYRDLLVNNEEPVRLIILLAGQIRSLIDIFCLRKQGKSSQEIAHELKIHEYRVKLARENERYIDLAKLQNIMEQLYQLDFKIKSGQVDRFFGFEMLLINFNNA